MWVSTSSIGGRRRSGWLAKWARMAASALASISRAARAAEHTHTIMSQSSAASMRGPGVSAPVRPGLSTTRAAGSPSWVSR